MLTVRDSLTAAANYMLWNEPIRLLIVDDSAADVEFYEYLLKSNIRPKSSHNALCNGSDLSGGDLSGSDLNGREVNDHSVTGHPEKGYDSGLHAPNDPLLYTGRSIEIRSALTGDEGVDLCSEWKPHCILLDYMLPDINGIEFIEEIMLPDGMLPAAVVVSTGQGDEQVAVEVMKSGAHDYVVKNGLVTSELIKILHNALEKFHLEQQLRDRQEELTLFAARASHDLVSPLSNLSLCAQILKYDSEARYDEGTLNILDTVLQHIDHMAGMLKGLSTYARVGRSGVSFEPVDLTAQVHHIVSLHEGQILEADAQIIFGELPTIWGDPIGISQLLQNLLTNALKYRSQELPIIRIQAKRRDLFWIISMQDNGIGIEPQFYKQMFEPFWRLHDRDTYPGSGLGLSTCMKIVRQHRGEMWVDSAPNQGTTIYFTLPAYNRTTGSDGSHTMPGTYL